MRGLTGLLVLGLLSGCGAEGAIDPDVEGELWDVDEGTSALLENTRTPTGFAWTPYAAGDRTLGLDFAMNGQHDEVRVDHLSTGRYFVWFEGHEHAFVNVQVVSYDDNPNRCKLVSFGANAGKLGVEVRCFTVAGRAVDNRFAVWFSGQFEVGGNTAAFVLSERTDADHEPQDKTFLSSGKRVLVDHTGTGQYTVRLRGLDIALANAHVTAMGTSAHFCQLRSWLVLNGSVDVRVACFDTFGAPANSLFSLLYVGTRVDPQWSRSWTWANQETNNAWYNPDSSYNWNQPWRTRSLNAARRLDTKGRYAVRFDTYPDRRSTNAMVTAFDYDDPTWCKPEIWTPIGADVEVIVNCFRPDGAKVDSKFTASYTYAKVTHTCDALCNGVCCSP